MTNCSSRPVAFGAAPAALLFAMAVGFAPARAKAADQADTPPDVDLQENARAPDPTGDDDPPVVAAATATTEVPPGFYRDRQGRVMQVSFDFGRRLWLGVGYAPRMRPSGTTEMAPAAFDFGAAYDTLSEDGRTRYRLHVLDGQVRLHQFGLDVTAFRYDLSHRYEHPILRVTTFVGEPARHDLYLNIGLFAEALHFETNPRGIDGEHSLTLGSLQATLDLWQSADLRSYVRLRMGPGVEFRTGPWGDTHSLIGFLPQVVLEGHLMPGKRDMQQLTFRARACLLRTLELVPGAVPGGYFADAEAAYEIILLAINDQPVSLRVAAQSGYRGDARTDPATPTITTPVTPGWEWKGTVGFRMSFLSPPVVRR